MPYTLAKGFIWVALALLLGIVIGWLLRSIVAKRQVARARTSHVDSAEMERLRGRVANLEPVVAERDRLRDELDRMRSEAAASDDDGDVALRQISGVGVDVAGVDDAGVGQSAASLDDLTVTGSLDPVEATGASPPSTPDVAGAAAVLGRSIALDDLKVIDGIGPKIEALCNGIGIRTWFDLSTTEVSLLRTMLADAGPRFKSQDPSTWPEQAALLAHGRWDDFRALTDALEGGRAVD